MTSGLRDALFGTTFLTGVAVALAPLPALAGDLVVDDVPGATHEVSGGESYGTLWLGDDNPGQTLLISSEDSLTTDTASFGVNEDSDGNKAVLSGNGLWFNDTDLSIGYRGSNNSLTVKDSAKLGSDKVMIGRLEGSNGNDLTVDGASAEVQTYELRVGDNGSNNSMTIKNGGTVLTGLVYVGDHSTAGGNTLTVTGPDSSLSAVSGLIVGNDGSYNKLTFTDSGIGSASEDLTVGAGSGAYGNAVNITAGVSGAGSLAVGGHFYLGYQGAGNTLGISGGGSLHVSKDMLLGAQAGSDSNRVEIGGAGSTLVVDQTLYVGRNGGGNIVVVKDQGDLVTGNARIGGGSGTTGYTSANAVILDGEDAQWTINGSLRIGDGGSYGSGANLLDIRNGAVEMVGGKNTFIGYGANDSANTLLVGGRNASFSTTGDVTIGNNGGLYNGLAARDGGQVSAGNITVNRGNSLTVTGGSSLTATGLTMQADANYNYSQLNFGIGTLGNNEITINGVAQLDGILSLSGTALQKRETVLTASGGVSGTFGIFYRANYSENFDIGITYDPDAVYVDWTAYLGRGSNLTDQQQAVANAISGYFNGGGVLNEDTGGLFESEGATLAGKLDFVSGEAGATGAANALRNSSSALLNLLTEDGRDTSGQQTASAAQVGGVAVEPASAAPGHAWRSWGRAFGGTSELPGEAAAGSHDTAVDLYGIAAGWDRDLSSDTTVGLALAGGRTAWTLDDGFGTGDSTFLAAGAHGRQAFGASYLALAGAYGWHALATERGALTADFSASSLGGRIEGGHRFGSSLALTPYGALQADAAFLPGYEETGGGLALSYDDRTATALRGEAGLKLDATAGGATLSARLAYAHDWLSDPDVTAGFAALPGTAFTVTGAEAPDQLALVSLGASLPVTRSAILSAGFDGQFGDDYQSYAGSLGLTARW